jgi:hypothetical protein
MPGCVLRGKVTFIAEVEERAAAKTKALTGKKAPRKPAKRRPAR